MPREEWPTYRAPGVRRSSPPTTTYRRAAPSGPGDRDLPPPRRPRHEAQPGVREPQGRTARRPANGNGRRRDDWDTERTTRRRQEWEAERAARRRNPRGPGGPGDPRDPYGHGDWGDPPDDGGRGATAVRTSWRGKPRRSWPQRLILTLLVLLIILPLTGAGWAVWFMRKLGSIEEVAVDTDTVAAGEPANYLIVGSDTRSGANAEYGSEGGRRSDTIMVLRLDPRTRQAAVLSLPRDLMVEVPGRTGLSMLNSTFTESVDLLMETIRLNFQIEINHYVEIDFAGFKQMVDAVGGVPIYIDRALRDDGSGLLLTESLGCITLNGEQALAYARSREMRYMQPNNRWSDINPRADLDRIERQQNFIRIALAHIISQVKSNPLRLTELVSVGTGMITVSEGTDVLALADQFRDFDLNNLASYPLPVVDYEPDPDRVAVDTVEADPILNVFRGLDSAEVSPRVITVNVLNGTDVQDQALNAAGALQTIGFRLGERSDYPEKPLARTTIFHAPGQENLGQRVMRHITGYADLLVDDTLSSGEVTLATGVDFTNVHIDPTPVEQLPGATTTTAPPADGGTAPPDATATPLPPPTTEENEYVIGVACP